MIFEIFHLVFGCSHWIQSRFNLGFNWQRVQSSESPLSTESTVLGLSDLMTSVTSHDLLWPESAYSLNVVDINLKTSVPQYQSSNFTPACLFFYPFPPLIYQKRCTGTSNRILSRLRVGCLRLKTCQMDQTVILFPNRNK